DEECEIVEGRQSRPQRLQWVAPPATPGPAVRRHARYRPSAPRQCELMSAAAPRLVWETGPRTRRDPADRPTVAARDTPPRSGRTRADPSCPGAGVAGHNLPGADR